MTMRLASHPAIGVLETPRAALPVRLRQAWQGAAAGVAEAVVVVTLFAGWIALDMAMLASAVNGA